MPDDTTTAPEDRYAVADHGVSGCYVVDRVLDKRIGPSGITWAAAFSEAQRLNRLSRAASIVYDKPTACSCNCARLRAALEQIAQQSGERHVLRIANEALDRMAQDRGNRP